MTAPPFVIIGIEKSELAVEHLMGGHDLCFGRLFAKTAPECISCRAPVSMPSGEIKLLKEVCAAQCLGPSAEVKLNRITSQEVMERLERGETFVQLFRTILGDAHPGLAATAARQLLVDRLVYLKAIGMETPPVPKTKVLLGDLSK